LAKYQLVEGSHHKTLSHVVSAGKNSLGKQGISRMVLDGASRWIQLVKANLL
jgi:hypothetical protein